MNAPETPKFSGLHRRCGRTFSELSTFETVAAVIALTVSLALFIGVLYMTNRSH